jgi:hypothetical protein
MVRNPTALSELDFGHNWTQKNRKTVARSLEPESYGLPNHS